MRYTKRYKKEKQQKRADNTHTATSSNAWYRSHNTNLDNAQGDIDSQI